MTLGSLFDGISGFPLAASWCGIETKWISEIDPYCLKVSKKNFPNAIQYGNIKELHSPEYTDIISGGFPCQPFSKAGKQRSEKDDRYLWPEMLRVIDEVRPRWVVGENVTGIINLALDEVLSSLEDKGYTIEGVFNIPSCGVSGDSIRERIWILAHSYGKGFFHERMVNSSQDISRQSLPGIRSQVRNGIKLVTESVAPSKFSYCRPGGGYVTEPLLVRANNGVSTKLDEDRLKGCGNAIDPYVAYEIFKAIVEIENSLTP